MRWALLHGKHGRVALKHYRESGLTAEETAELVSWELTGSDASAKEYTPAVQAVLEELVPIREVRSA